MYSTYPSNIPYSSHDLFLAASSLDSFAFLFEAAYLLLLILTKSPTLELPGLLPKMKQLLAWIDVLTELSFLHQTTLSLNPESQSSDEFSRVERAITKISAILEKEAQLKSMEQELSGTLEAITENFSVMRATLLKEEVQGGELIRDQIVI